MPRQAAEVALREIPSPLSTFELPAVPARPVTAPDLRAEQAPSVAVRDIPAPTAAPTPEAAGSTASSQAAAPETGAATQPSTARQSSGDRKSVVLGKRVSVRVDLGGRRIIKQKNRCTTI